MRKLILSAALLAPAILFGAPSWADSPPDVMTPDTHLSLIHI